MRALGLWGGRPGVKACLLGVLGLCLLVSAPGWSKPVVVINEVMASNTKTSVDPQGDFDDWIELYNAGDAAADVSGMYLTDDQAMPRKWRIPTSLPGLRGGTVISPKGYLIVWADGDILDAGLHANFKLGADGEEVHLFAADGVTLTDSLEFDQQTPDVSYGRYPDGGQTLRFFEVPTPGHANSEGYLGEVAPPRFSHERGFYSSPFDVMIETATEGARIVYTLDGYAPHETRAALAPARPSAGRRPGGAEPAPVATDTEGILYTGPIRISKTTCLRVIAEKPGWKPTPIYTHTYIFDLRPELATLPVVSLVGGASTVFYEPNGIMAIVGGTYTGGVWGPSGADSYNNILNRDLERPVSAEWLFRGDDAGFHADCGLRVHGSPWIRPRYVRQNGFWSGDGKISLRLYFRGEYGQSRLEYPLIPQSNVEQFATVVLRAGHNDRTNPFIKDELLRRLHKDMGQAACTGTFANLFINGEYKGFYNPTEHVKEESCQQWFDSDKPWDVMTMNGIRDGDSASFDAMISYARGHNLADPSYYAELCRKLDVVSFIDYLIIRLWPNDWDWPQNNWSAAGERSATGRWKFFVWDAEGTFESSQLQLDRFSELGSQGNANGYLYQALRANPDFRLLFADRIYKHFYNGGALTDENIQRRFSELRGELQSVLPNMATYIVDTWVPNRRPIFLNACTRVGMYTFGGPSFAVNGTPQHGGGQVAPGDRLSLSLTDGRGTIYYTLDGTDPAQSALALGPTMTPLVARDSAKRILVPTGPLATDWRSARGFDDSSWLSSSGLPGGIGFGRGSGYESHISANLGNRMYNINGSCYIRIPFQFNGDKGDLDTLVMQIQYDDGFVAYLNGNEVARRNFVGEPAWDSTATASHDNADAIVFEIIDLSAHLGKLRQGDNVLAIHGLNASANNSDFLIGVELTASQEDVHNNPSGPQTYLGPIALMRTTQVKARIRGGNTWSALAEAVFAVGPVKENLRISEIMYHPGDAGRPGDPNAEYIELTNIGAEPLDLSFVQFTKGVRFTFPDLQLAPHAFCLVVKDRAAFEARYGPGLPVAGQYDGSLSDNGEQIELQDAAGAVIHSFRYEDNWFRTTDGLGYSLTVRHLGAPATSWSTEDAWRPSVAPGGAPGSDDSGIIPIPGAVVINELLADPAGNGYDWIELSNTTDQAIDIGGWFLSDDADLPTRYEIAKGTILAPYACRVFTADRHFSNPGDPGCRDPFGLSRTGESIYLCSGAGGQVTGYRERVQFGPSATGVTFGRYVDRAGGVHFVPLHEATPGAANADPATGPVVITEIMYHTESPGDVEYVELQNVSSAEVVLYDIVEGAPWRLTGGRDVELLFPEDPPISLSPRGYLLLTKDRALFESRYGLFPSVPILAWGVGSLSDSGARIELSRPGEPSDGIRTWIGVDYVTYSDGTQDDEFPSGLDPWPVQADGGGQSLTRIDVTRWGDDPLNWLTAAPSPGAARQRPNR